jgi:raffinose/stachyose/melibiose transport system permease protein
VTTRLERTLSYAILTFFAVIVLVPIALLVLLALRPSSVAGAGFQFTHLDFGDFATAWREAHFGRYLFNSVIISVGSALLSSLLALLAGYAFGTMKLAGGKAVFSVFLAGIMVPLTAIIIPLYYNFRELGLANSLFGLILANAGMSLGFATFWMRSFFRSFPKALLESAALDGTTRWGALWRICVPNAKPAILSMLLLVFMWTWNDYFMALVLISNQNLQPASLGLGAFQSQHVTDYNLLAAGAVLMALPVVVVYLFFQRQFIRGIFAGALKA